jgi:hypothetical protein
VRPRIIVEAGRDGVADSVPVYGREAARAAERLLRRRARRAGASFRRFPPTVLPGTVSDRDDRDGALPD